MLWVEKFKTVGSGTLNGVKWVRGCAKKRVVLFDMTNVKVMEGVNQRASKSPVIVISSNIKTLRDGN